MQANNSKPFQHMFKCLKDALYDPGESLLTLKVNSITSLSSIYPSNLSTGDLTQVTWLVTHTQRERVRSIWPPVCFRRSRWTDSYNRWLERHGKPPFPQHTNKSSIFPFFIRIIDCKVNLTKYSSTFCVPSDSRGLKTTQTVWPLIWSHLLLALFSLPAKLPDIVSTQAPGTT